jgi:hypothetical protein
VNNSATTEARKNKHRFKFLIGFEIFDVCLAKFKNNQILLNKLATDVQ